MSPVILALLCVVHVSWGSSSQSNIGYNGTPNFVIIYKKIYNITFPHQKYTKFLECVCTDSFKGSNIATGTLDQHNIAFVSNVECDVNGTNKETSRNVHCSILEQKTGNHNKDFSIYCVISKSNEVSGSFTKNFTHQCSNKSVIIKWESDMPFDLIYEKHINANQNSHQYGIHTPKTLSTIPPTTTHNQMGNGDLNISAAVEQVNEASSVDEQVGDAGVMSTSQIVYAVLFAAFFLTVSFILGVNRERLVSLCSRQRRIFSEKTTPISQGANPDVNDKDNTPKDDFNNLTKLNLEVTPHLHLQLMNESRRDGISYQTRGNDVKERNDTEQGVDHGETDLYLDHIYAEPSETLRQANSNIYDDASTERQSVIIALPQRNQTRIDGAGGQRYYEVELEEDTRDAVQGVSEEGFGGDVSVVDASGDGYEVPRDVPRKVPGDVLREVPIEVPRELPKRVFRIVPKEVLTQKLKNVSYSVKKEEDVLNRIYETIPNEEICLNTKLNMIEPVGKSSYFELEVNDEEEEISKHQNIRPIRETDRDPTRQNFGDGYEVPVKHTCYPMKGRELNLQNGNNAFQDGKVIYDIIRETNLSIDNLCDETVETIRREDVNIYDTASVENLPVIISLPRRNLIIEDGASNQRYFEVELEDDTNDMVSCGSEDRFSEGDGLVSLSNDGYEVPRNKFTHVRNAETKLEGPLHNACEVLPDGEVPL